MRNDQFRKVRKTSALVSFLLDRCVDDARTRPERKGDGFDQGREVPQTLGEYRDLCNLLGPGSKAVAFLDEKIAASPLGRDEPVLADDGQVRALLVPMLLVKP